MHLFHLVGIIFIILYSNNHLIVSPFVEEDGNDDAYDEDDS